jgi:hypothetical protein
MKSTLKFIVLFFTFILLFSCKDSNDEPNTKSLNIDIQGLDALGSDFVYEGWIIVNGSPVSTGTFSDVSFPKSFTVSKNDLDSASKFVLSIEPANDSDPAPSNTKILVGDFVNNSANLSTASVGDFSNTMGKYILATPTNGANTDENSGIWFLDLPNSSPPPLTGLTLPALPVGWKYEGWVVINGTPVTTGKFTNVNATDEFNGYSGNQPLGMPNGNDGFFPGEDFLTNAPNGLTFPTDLAGMTAVISVEPDPDNSTMPFTLKPLVGMIPNNATDHVTYMLDANLSSLPTGTATK